MTIQSVKSQIQASIDVKASLLGKDALMQQVFELAERCTAALRSGGKVIFCGNGGSFADAQHLSAEFTSRFLFDRPGLPSLALGTNSSAMTAIGNDYGYENVFAREIQAIATPADVLIAITTSGNSGNILKALEAAKKANVPAVVLTGAGRGMLDATTETLNVPSTDTARIQECHILLGHIICGLVEESIFGSLRAENA
jgi:D-sedoheptulose 7-phosphate isomerase